MEKIRECSYSRLGVGYLGKQFLIFLPMLLLVIIFSIIDSVTYTYVPIFIQYIMSILTNENSDVNLPRFILNIFNQGATKELQIVYASLGLSIFQLLRSLLKVVSSIVRQVLGESLTKRMRHELYAHIENLSYSYHIASDKGELLQRCTNDVDTVRMAVCNQLPEVISIFSILISSVYQMIRINRHLTFISMIIVPVSFISSFLFCRYVTKKYEEIEDAEENLTRLIEADIDNVRVIKACNNENYEIKRFEEASRNYAEKNYHLNKVSAYFWGFSDMTTLIQYFITCIVAVSLVKSGTSSLGIAQFAALVSLVGSFIWPVRNLGRIIADTGKSLVSSGRIKELLINDDEFLTDNANLKPVIVGKIEFKDVSFKFADTDKHLLNHISFKINKGESIALMGRTGAGKSTIAKLLTRFLTPESGEILIDDVNINEIEKHHLRKNIGLVLQEPFLYAKTVEENIAITNKDTSFDQIEEVARISTIDHDIRGFKEGYETLVGEKGVTLSGGQKQRVAISRMLLDNKPVLILDDSLSALDTETDLLIRHALRKTNKDTTFIVITHRISTARNADKIIVLDDGKIDDIGRHEDLIKKNGLYRHLWNIQGKIEEDFLNLMEEEVK